MMSEATYEPPGLSTRKTIALIESSSRASLIASATVSEPIVGEPVSGFDSLSPRVTAPTP